MGALTKGWGFFASQALKGAKTVNDAVLQPAQQRLAEAEIGKTVGVIGARAGEAGRAGFEGFQKFVEGDNGYRKPGEGPGEDKRDFWESFGEPAQAKPSALGTSAMKSTGGSGQGGFGGGSAGGNAGAKKKDDWDDDW